jgi:hypothetical protein
LLIVIAIIAALIGILFPVLSGARRKACSAVCTAHLREFSSALAMCADNFDGRLMPLAYTSVETVGAGPPVYWWGTNLFTQQPVDYRGRRQTNHQHLRLQRTTSRRRSPRVIPRRSVTCPGKRSLP